MIIRNRVIIHPVGSQLVLLCLLALFMGSYSYADKITVDGVAYKDVLVAQTETSYYVRVPTEGRVFFVDRADVDASTVEIVDDPFYRDELKVIFKSVKNGEIPAGLSKSDGPTDPDFEIPTTFKDSSVSGQAAGSAGSKGLGLPRGPIQSLLTSVGFKFTGSGEFVTGTMQDGTSIELLGPESNLSGLVVRAQGPMAQIQGSMAQLGPLTQASAPWFGPWMQQNIGTLLSAGRIQKTQNGVSVSISMKPAAVPGQMAIEFSMFAV